jgi:hypothetical protein
MTLIDSEHQSNYRLNIYQNLDTRLIKNLVSEIFQRTNISAEVAAQWHNEKSFWTITFQWEVSDIYADPPESKPYSFTKIVTVQDLKVASVGNLNVLVVEIAGIINQSLPDIS